MAERSKEKSLTNPRGLKRVLVARFSALGDVAMVIPVLYSAARCYPQVEFMFITRPMMTSMFVNAPHNLRVVGVDLKTKYTGTTAMWCLFKDLRREFDFDAFVDLHDVIRTQLLRLACRLHGVPVRRINKGRRGKRALTRRNNKIMLPLTSSRARYREVFYAIGLPLEERFEGLFGRGGSPKDMLPEIVGRPESGVRWIGVAPFAKHAGKIYPVDMMEKVVAELSSDIRNRVILFGGGEEEERVLNRWVESYPRCVSLAGRRLGFPVELAVMSHCKTVVSMDSGNMHLASLVNTPVVSVWGATHPYCGFKGWHQRDANIIQLPLTCRPCSVFGDKPCYRGDYLCLSGIAPSRIVEKVTEILNK
ncbi:MAG: glycosyltransferase family 9 protein [Muribaculaceae bacterium]|nr:glycosyltransferase family 9 protein [Muribaculaceae bacterium]